MSPSKPRKSENGATMSSRFGRTDGQRLWMGMEGACLRSRTLSLSQADFCRVTRDKSSHLHLSRRVERGGEGRALQFAVFLGPRRKGRAKSLENSCASKSPHAPSLLQGERERERERAGQEMKLLRRLRPRLSPPLSARHER